MKIITRGRICIVLGCVAIAIAASLVNFNFVEDNEAGESASALLTQVEAQVTDTAVDPDPHGDMKVADVNGQSFIGIITIPAIDIRLPIHQDWSSENAKVAPCRYKGSVYENDLIVAGHNYQRHFGKLNQLHTGDTVIVTDIDGRQYYYEVTYMEDIGTYDVDAMDAGEWDFTVFTCTIGGASRVTVRCEFVKVVTPGSGESVIREIENAVSGD